MSLDFSLYIDADTGGPEPYRVWLLDVNATHNLVPMWERAGVYAALYESDGKRAGDLTCALQNGYNNMVSGPRSYEALEPPNGWGTYDGALAFLGKIIEASRRHPMAIVDISR